MKITIIQQNIIWKDFDANIKRLEQLVADAERVSAPHSPWGYLYVAKVSTFRAFTA